MSLKPGPDEKIFSLVRANFLPRAYAVWTRSTKNHPWQFHTAYRKKSEAQKASQGLSYASDVRITTEGYRATEVKRSR